MADDRTQQPDIDAEWESHARYLSGECNPEEERRIRSQLAEDGERAALLTALDVALTPAAKQPLPPDRVEAALAAVMRRRELDAPAGDTGVVARGAAQPTSMMARFRSQWRHARVRAAAALLIVAGGGLLWRDLRPADQVETEPGVATGGTASQYVTASGTMDSITLVDGTTIVMGPASTIELAPGFGSASREVTLVGQAYFDIIHDDALPFVVRTSRATLHDIGTSFTVRTDSLEGTQVAVTSGVVDLVSAGSGKGSRALLRAGDRALVTEEGVRVERGTVTRDELDWTRGVVSFRDAPLANVASELRRWFGIELIVTDSRIASQRITATFERESADDVDELLAAVLGTTVTRTGDTLRVGAPARDP